MKFIHISPATPSERFKHRLCRPNEFAVRLLTFVVSLTEIYEGIGTVSLVACSIIPLFYTMFIVGDGPILTLFDVAIGYVKFVRKISGSFKRRLSWKYHPQSRITFMFLLWCANESLYTLMTSGTISDLFKSLLSNLHFVFNLTSASFSRVIVILKHPFCSGLSPTCYLELPLDNPIQTFHLGSPN